MHISKAKKSTTRSCGPCCQHDRKIWHMQPFWFHQSPSHWYQEACWWMSWKPFRCHLSQWFATGAKSIGILNIRIYTVHPHLVDTKSRHENVYQLKHRWTMLCDHIEHNDATKQLCNNVIVKLCTIGSRKRHSTYLFNLQGLCTLGPRCLHETAVAIPW